MSKLREVRIREGYTLETLAAASGVSLSAIWRVENRRANPTVALLRKLADALGVSIHELIDTRKGAAMK